MPGFVHLLQCVGRAAVKNGGQALANLVPFGGVLFEIAKDAYEEYRKKQGEAELRAALADMTLASPIQIRQASEDVVDQEARGLSDEIRLNLISYLDQMPVTVRQSLRRPSDPDGNTVPTDLPLLKPEDLLSFLPSGLPRFKPGDRSPAADWELVEMLGKGGFGEVWKASHLFLPSKKPVALKICLDPVAAESLKNEVLIHRELDRVRHQGEAKGIVPLLETFLGADPPCLMYEYIEGGNLAGLIQDLHRKRQVPPDLANRIVQRLARIMSFPHSLNPPLVHRDLKPANILVRRHSDNKATLHITDFGIGGLAARQALREKTGERSLPALTRISAIRGAYTPLYASPEQMKGSPADPRDDVYSLGVIWYQILTGDLLSEAPRGSRWKQKLAERGMSPKLIGLLNDCFEAAEDRPKDAGALEKQLAELSKPPPPPPPPSAGRKEPTMKVLHRHGVLAEGTEIELLPAAMSDDALVQDPKLFRARIGNVDSKKSVIWEYDRNAYSLTELSVKLEQYGLWWFRPKTFELWRIAGQTESMWDQADRLR
jgi:serine/threonine protein kinase